MKYPIPSRVPLPSFRPDMPMVPQQFPQAPMAPPQQQAQPGMGARLGGFIRNNSDALAAMSQGLLGGQTASEQWAGGMSGLTGAVSERRKKSKTMDWMMKNAPEYAEAVEAGALSLPDAYKMSLEARKPEKPDFTSDMKEYNLAREQGFDGTFVDYMKGMKKAGATNVTTNIGESDKFQEETAKRQAGMFGDLVESGWNAKRTMVQIDRLDGLLKSTPQGAGGAMRMAAGNLGIPFDGSDEVQAAQAIINSLVPQQRPPGSGPMSDADLELFKQSLPRIINQPGGNETIIQTMRGIAEYTAAQGEIANMVTYGQITPQEGAQRLNALPNPLANVQSGNMAAPTAPPPSNIDALVDKWSGQ